MAIAFNKYVDITSGVGAGVSVPRRELIARLFSTNPLIPTSDILEFTTLDSVLDYFGSTAPEYLRASFYFGWINKRNQKIRKISYSRWTNAAVAPVIYGAPLAGIPTTLTALQAIEDGSFTLTLGGITNEIAALDFSGAANLTAVAALIQAAIRLETGTQWTAATVVYESVRGSFNFTGGDPIVANVIVAAGVTGTDISAIMGWLSPSAILSDGNTVETITATLSNSAEDNNNFGSFVFVPSLTLDQITEASAWNLTQNILYQYGVPVSAANAQAYFDALENYAGVGVTLAPLSTEYPEMVPGMILAATNYAVGKATQNYMFQMFNLTASVTTTTLSDFYDGIRVNYYGNTQQAGNIINFYQRGKLMGLPSAPLDMNTYANEQWLKDSIGAGLMQLLLNSTEVTPNEFGTGLTLLSIQSTIDQALANGTISIGKPLTSDQKGEITEKTGDPEAWRDVQDSGYWINAFPVLIGSDWEIDYLMFYSKDDVVRKLKGINDLI